MNNSTSFYYAVTYSGCFFGAGFVAGNEMRDFFSKFGIYGFLLFGISIFICTLTTYRITVLKNTYSYKSYETVLFGTNNKIFTAAFSFVKHLFMLGLVTFCVSCAGEILYRLFGLDTHYGALLLVTVTLIISLSGKTGVLTVFSVSVPLISIFCLLCAAHFTFSKKINFSPNQSPLHYGLHYPLLYAGYNIFAGVGTFAVDNKKQNVKKSLFLGSVILFICGCSVMLLTLISPAKNSMPVLDIIYGHNSVFGFIFAVLLFLSLISTAVSRIFILSNAYSQKQSCKKYICITVCVCAYILSFMGFNNIIKLIYPIFGIIGTFSVALINVKYRIKYSSSNTKLFCVFSRR